MAIGTVSVTREPAHLARLYHLQIERIEPGDGIEIMWLAATRTEPLGAMPFAANLTGEKSPTDIARLVDRLAGRAGDDAPFTVGAVESDLPERAVAREIRLSRPTAGLPGSVPSDSCADRSQRSGDDVGLLIYRAVGFYRYVVIGKKPLNIWNAAAAGDLAGVSGLRDRFPTELINEPRLAASGISARRGCNEDAPIGAPPAAAARTDRWHPSSTTLDVGGGHLGTWRYRRELEQLPKIRD
ncbi:hypothetical protein [Sphingomonas sp. UYP23]